MRKLLHELRRRNVLRVFLAYLAMAWLVVQVLETTFPLFDLPDAYIRWVIIAFAILLIPVVALSWAFEWTAKGIETQASVDAGTAPVSTRGFDRVLIALLSVAVLYFATDKFLFSSTEPSASGQASVAVLPFTDRTAAQDNAYLADGLAEELLDSLSRNPALKVAARTSSFRFRGSDESAVSIAAQLGVAFLLEGSVRDLGDRLRISVRLVSAKDGINVWSENFDRRTESLYAAIDDIGAAVEDQLDVTDTRSPQRLYSPDPESYVLFLQGGHLSGDGSPAGRSQAVERFRQALEIDPDFSRAWSNLSSTVYNQMVGGELGREAGYGVARDAAVKAIETDPESPHGYRVLALIASSLDGNLGIAVENMRRAINAEPTNTRTLNDAAVLMLNIGQLEDAVALFVHLADRSPLDVTALRNAAVNLTYVNRLDEAEAYYRRVLALVPDFHGGRYGLGVVQLLQGRYAEALEQFESEQDEAYRVKGRALAHFSLGNVLLADDALAELTETFGDQWPSEVAHVHAWRNEIDQGFVWLDREFEKYGPGGWGEWQRQRLYDNLRSDSRWQEFLFRTGAAAEQLAVYDLDLPMEQYR